MRKISYQKPLIMTVVIILIVLGTRPLHDWLLPNPISKYAAANPTLSLDMLSRNMPLVTNIFRESYSEGSFNLAIVILFFMSASVALLVFIYKNFKSDRSDQKVDRLNFILLFSVITIFANITAFLLTDREVNARHFAPVFILPVMFLPLIFQKYISINFTNKIQLVSIVILLVLVFWQIRERFMHQKFYTSYTTPLSQCVDNFIEQTGARYGAAQYWQSKDLYILSKYPIKMAQYDGSLYRYRWITTTRWYREKYDFVLLDTNASKPYYKIDGNKIIRSNGEPDEIFQCGKTYIYYYKNGLTM